MLIELPSPYSSYIGYGSSGVESEVLDPLPGTDAGYGYNSLGFFSAIDDYLLFLETSHGYLIYLNVIDGSKGYYPIKLRGDRGYHERYFHHQFDQESLLVFGNGELVIYDLSKLPHVSSTKFIDLPEKDQYEVLMFSNPDRGAPPKFSIEYENGYQTWLFDVENNSFVRVDGV